MLTEWIAALSVTVAIARSGRPPPVSRIAALCGPVADQAHPGGRGSTWLIASVAGSAVVALGIAPSLVAVLVVGCVACRRLFRSRQAAAGRAACTLATVEVTFALAGELRAGRTPAQALAAVAETAGPLRLALIAVQSAVAVGADVSTELMAASDLPGAERLRWVAAAWSVAESAGGRVATVLERLSESMDNDNELRQELDAAMAAPRATIVLLAGLPVLGLLLGQAVGAHPVALLIHRPLGWGLLGVALILDTAGVVVTRAIARRALGP